MRYPRLTACAVSAALAAASLVLPSTAYAAQGELIIGNQTFRNPSECYNSTTSPMFVRNRTDQIAFVSAGEDCSGIPLGIVRPGAESTFKFGRSVWVNPD